MRTVILSVLATLIVGFVSAMAVAMTGSFNVSADQKDSAALHWLFSTTRMKSVQTRAASVEVPEFRGAKQLENGFRSYREMCAMCHTPPGAKDSPFTKGMNPKPPELSKSAKNMTDAELFWVTKNGIRMTGMPSWGTTHSDQELWDIIAFVKALPNMDSNEYQELDKRLPPGHAHGPGSDHGNAGHHDSLDHHNTGNAMHDNSDGHHDTMNKAHDNSDGHHDTTVKKNKMKSEAGAHGHKDDGHTH